MSKLYDLLSAMCRKIKKSDWEQNNPTAADYVKNRPFWTDEPEEKVIFEEHLVMEEGWAEFEGPYPVFEEGQEYTVNFNGENYTCIAYYDDHEEAVVIGNVTIDDGENVGNNEPFAVVVWNDGYMYIVVEEPGEYNISITGNIAEVHKIDNKYIDDNIINGMEKAYFLADEAYHLAETVNHRIGSDIPTFSEIDSFIYGKLVPYNKNELQVGESTYLAEYPDRWKNAVYALCKGSSISGIFVYIANGKNCAERVILVKTTDTTAEGGAWAIANCDSPRYYYIVLHANGNSFYYRYV